MSRKSTFQPRLENLEDRMLPASTVVVLDYTPDYSNATGGLQDTFYSVRYQDGQVPKFFDFDGDRKLTPNDVSAAAKEISGRVRGYYANYLNMNVSIISGDILRNDKFGDQWLRYGLQRSDVQVNVLYFGGRSREGEFGLAPRASDGTNIEGFAEVYTRTIALWMQRYTPNATPAQFAREVASTAAHELGHMLGLRHATSGVANNIMVSGRDRTNNVFTNQNVYTEGGRVQNAHQELVNSFRGQATEYRFVNYASPDIAPEHFDHDDEGDDHGCCCCGMCASGIEDHLAEESAGAAQEDVELTARDAAFTLFSRHHPLMDTTAAASEAALTGEKDVLGLPADEANRSDVIDSLFSLGVTDDEAELVLTGLRSPLAGE